ncbi:hypothetical protein [Actinophytocola sediminis]
MDEMDMVKRLTDVPPLRQDAYERARAMLGTAMATSERPEMVAAPARKKRFTWIRDFRAGVGVIGVAAAVVAVVVVAATLQAPWPVGPTAEAPVVESGLVTLAADVKASGGSLPGDASLVIMTTTVPGGQSRVRYNLYTDKGEIFYAEERSALAGVVVRGDNIDDADNSSVIEAARFAAGNDLDKARVGMINASRNPWGVGLSPAEAQKVWDRSEAELAPILRQKGYRGTLPRPRPTGKALADRINNTLWSNSFSALAAGAANSEVRAGVLRLMSTIPEVSVTKGTADGQPTLILTAGSALFGGHSEYVLVINARTGLPIRSENTRTTPGEQPSPSSTYESSRVKVADIAVGKF